jgi:bifunctional non-homologous end joining protein LigD
MGRHGETLDVVIEPNPVACLASDGPTGFKHACMLGLEGIVSKRKGSPYRSGRSPDWLKMKNPACAAVKREAEEDWGKERWR